MNEDKRLIEDYLPIEAISKEASREKSVRKGHISTLHLWWARRPLVACRAAVYGALVPASQFVPENGLDNKKQSLGRANAAKFVKRLCRYPSASKPEVKADTERAIQDAQGHILQAHAQRLSAELAETAKTGTWPAWADEFKWPKDKTEVTREDIESGSAPHPRVLDMFAGGGAIPLEALRLGCEAYALDLNPVAHIIELCTLVYPQKYGKSDPNARGMTGPKNEKGKTTWGGLAEEVRYWGKWVLEKVQAEIGYLYPLIPDPEAKDEEINPDAQHVMGFAKDPRGKLKVKRGYLTPIAYLWTRTVKCKNPTCGATVPLVKQTWLCKKKDRYVALRMVAPNEGKEVCFEVVEHTKEEDFDFDPAGFSSAGNATCSFCGAVSDVDYVKDEGWQGRLDVQLMAIIGSRVGQKGKVYLSPSSTASLIPKQVTIERHLEIISANTGLTIPDEPIANLPHDSRRNTLGITVRPYGFRTIGDLFTQRQKICLLSFASAIHKAQQMMAKLGLETDHANGVTTCLGAMLDKLSDFSSAQCTWNYTGGRGVKNSFGRQTISMTWDYCETDPFNPAGASWLSIIEDIPSAIEQASMTGQIAANVVRGSSMQLPWDNETFDTIVTDPPYYDNVPYADISDFFYAWLKRSIGHVHPQHFAGSVTPKKSEAIADMTRHHNSKDAARIVYEQMMKQSFSEASRVLKPGGQITIVYAHKTTLGWSTLVDAMRLAGFIVTEAWPLNTENPSRQRSKGSAALASSIFLVSRKRNIEASICSYELDVRPELKRIVNERVTTLWEMGISGADLVISCVGAGLHAFTRFDKVEYANGEEVPAEQFLAEVETVVLETILNRLSKEVGGNGSKQTSLAGVDPATRFYILWRYTYRWTELDSGEAIVFANGTHVELDGQGSLSQGSRALIEKKKSKYKLMDFKGRGKNDKLGMPENGSPTPLIDTLHRTLWLMENQPTKLAEFLKESQVNREQMRLVAQALAGPALKGGELMDISPSSELAALGKLTANWRSVVEDAARDSWDEGLGKEK